jgi:glycosyltransferase involved in cell wall biosynthesis
MRAAHSPVTSDNCAMPATDARTRGGSRDISRPLRVLHVIDSAGLYGAERVILELASELQTLGHASVIVSIGLPGSEEKPLERAARERGLQLRLVRMAAGPSLAGMLRLVRLIRDERADIVHAHGYKPDILLGFLPRWVRFAPLVATVHGYTYVGGLSRMALYCWLDRAALRRADSVVFVHHGMTAMPGFSRVQERRRRVIENGIPLASDSPTFSATETSTLDEEIVRFCGQGSVVVGAMGRLSREKGFDALVRALAEVVRDRSDVVGLILGEGEQRAMLERLVDDLGLRGRLLMPGYRSNATDYLRLFDVFALPSLTEGLPIVLLEAMQAGVPVVATRVGGVPSVLDDGRGGLLVDPGDWRALASAMRRCVDDRALAAQRAAHSLVEVSSRFSSLAMTKRYVELYRQVAGVH